MKKINHVWTIPNINVILFSRTYAGFAKTGCRAASERSAPQPGGPTGTVLFDTCHHFAVPKLPIEKEWHCRTWIVRKETEHLESWKKPGSVMLRSGRLTGIKRGGRTKGIIECQMSRSRRHINGTGGNGIHTGLFGGSVHRQINALRQSQQILFPLTLDAGVCLFLI